ncbi:MAG: hypothetical protein ACREBP_11110 [Sphingomicrobium sp.]
MRVVIALAVCVPLASACALDDKIAASRQDRCERADWKLVGQRDGVEGVSTQAERYQYICGELFKPGPYKEGLQEGLARRPRPPV